MITLIEGTLLKRRIITFVLDTNIASVVEFFYRCIGKAIPAAGKPNYDIVTVFFAQGNHLVKFG